MSARRAVLLPIVVGLVAAVAACGRVEASKTPLEDKNDLRAVCEGGGFIGPKRTAFPDAAAYAGGQPPLIIVEHGGIDHSSTAAGWNMFHSSDLDIEPIADPKLVQLVACAEHGDDYEQVGTCSFDEGETAEVLRSSAKVTIFEARTAEKVTEITVDAAEYTCPFLLYYQGKPMVYTSPTLQEYREALTEAIPGVEVVT